jgi:hypothetical protein
VAQFGQSWAELLVLPRVAARADHLEEAGRGSVGMLLLTRAPEVKVRIGEADPQPGVATRLRKNEPVYWAIPTSSFSIAAPRRGSPKSFNDSRNASTMAGSNCVPAQPCSSARASSSGRAVL